jgi:acyl-CoA synthetase (AMP-forming)/AMP-acid ligase II
MDLKQPLDAANMKQRNTLPAAFREALGRGPSRRFLVTDTDTVSYTDADRRIEDFACALMALGVEKGSRVGILMPDRVDWVVALLAITRVGAVAAPLSTFCQAPDLRYALLHNGIHTLLMATHHLSHNYVERLEAAAPGIASQQRGSMKVPELPLLRNVIVWGDCRRSWAHSAAGVFAQGAAATAPARRRVGVAEEQVTPFDDFIIDTSGSSAVLHTHESAVSTAREFIRDFDLRHDEVTYSVHPFFWAAGPNMALLPTICAGAALAFGWSGEAIDIIRTVIATQPTRLVLPPAQVEAVFAAPAPEDLHDVRNLRQASPPGVQLEAYRGGGGWILARPSPAASVTSNEMPATARGEAAGVRS